MTHGTSRHPKLLGLATTLGISRRDAVGMLQLLWEYTEEYAPEGDIGKFPDEDIAAAVEWNGNTGELLNALTHPLGEQLSGWLDPHPVHRLIIHDWSEHAPGYLRKRLSRQNRNFVRTVSANPTQPNPTRPDSNHSGENVGAVSGSRSERLTLQARAIIKMYGETVKPPSEDTSRTQAKRNALKRLRDGHAYADLQAAVVNYAEACALLKRDTQYRKNAGNFFGRDAVFEQFLPNDYKRPDLGDAHDGRRKPSAYRPPERLAD